VFLFFFRGGCCLRYLGEGKLSYRAESKDRETALANTPARPFSNFLRDILPLAVLTSGGTKPFSSPLIISPQLIFAKTRLHFIIGQPDINISPDAKQNVKI